MIHNLYIYCYVLQCSGQFITLGNCSYPQQAKYLLIFSKKSKILKLVKHS